MKQPIYLLQALICAVVISFIDSRSGEVQAAALLILVSTFIFGTLHARRAWVYATLIGLSIFAYRLVAQVLGWLTPIEPEASFKLAALAALIPAFIGAYSGAGLRWVLDGMSGNAKVEG